MATIEFYAKPGCINNARQKKLLQVGERCEAGFDPVRIDAWIGLDA